MDGGEERIYARAAAIRRPKQIARRIEGNIPAREVKTPLQIAIQNAPDPFTRELLVLYPQYLSFAISLTKKRDTAEDLVNLCIAKALNSAHTFEHGTNMRAWMFTIISNQFKSDYRKEQVRVRHLDKEKGGRAQTEPDQDASVDLSQALELLKRMPQPYRRALELVALKEMGYEAAARRMRVAVGTIKSRVNRARQMLRSMAEGVPIDEDYESTSE